MLNPLQTLTLAFTVVGQWRLARLAVRYGARRWLALYGVLLAAGLAAGWARSTLPGAVAHTWAYASSAAVLAYELVRWLSGRVSPPPLNVGRRRFIHAAGGVLIASPMVAVAYGALVERTNFRVREVDVPVPNLPPDLDGLRVVQLSDIHLSAFLSESELARVIDAANQTRAHLAVVTGDFITARGDPLDTCLRQVARLRADAGILACMGNHESYAGAIQYAGREGARLGIRFLRRQTAPLRFGKATLNLAGVDYQPLSHREHYLDGAERMILPGATNVLLSHNPDVFPVAAAQGWDLTVSGHTHGGQVTVEILDQSLNPARFMTSYVYGLYREGGRAAYVSRGIGTIGIPARIGAPPEIALLRLRRA